MGIKAIKCRTTTFWHPCCSHVLIWRTWTQQCWETRLPASEGENVWGACERIIIDSLFQLCMFYCFTSLNQRRFHVFFASTKLRPFKYKIHVCTSIKPLIDLAPFAAFTGFVCGWVFISLFFTKLLEPCQLCYHEWTNIYQVQSQILNLDWYLDSDMGRRDLFSHWH